MSSYIRPEIQAMRGYVPGEQPREGSITKLNTNENPYPSSPAVQRAIGRAIQAGLQKYPDPLATAFRNRAAELLGVEPNWILCGNGSDDILTIVTRAFVGQGDCLRLPYPSYILYKTLAQLQGAEAEEIHFEKDWSLGDNFTKQRSRLKLAFLPNPNSPSGTVIPPARVKQLAAALPCPLIVDEAYVDFADANCVSLVKETDKIMVSRSFSKSYALGWPAFRLHHRPASHHRAARKSQRFLQLRRPLHRRRHRRHRRSGLARRQPRQNPRHAWQAYRQPSRPRLCFCRIASQFRLEPAPQNSRETALRTTQIRRRPGAIHGLSRLG